MARDTSGEVERRKKALRNNLKRRKTQIRELRSDVPIHVVPRKNAVAGKTGGTDKAVDKEPKA